MRLEESIVARIKELCKEQNITINALANIAGIAPSTVYSLLNHEIKSPRISTIYRICGALHISLGEFCASEMFNNIDEV